jgi:hypothetical protein
VPRRGKEIRIDLPVSLKEILVDDGDLVNRQMKLPRIPARVTAAEIIRQVPSLPVHSLAIRLV